MHPSQPSRGPRAKVSSKAASTHKQPWTLCRIIYCGQACRQTPRVLESTGCKQATPSLLVGQSLRLWEVGACRTSGETRWQTLCHILRPTPTARGPLLHGKPTRGIARPRLRTWTLGSRDRWPWRDRVLNCRTPILLTASTLLLWKPI